MSLLYKGQLHTPLKKVNMIGRSVFEMSSFTFPMASATASSVTRPVMVLSAPGALLYIVLDTLAKNMENASSYKQNKQFFKGGFIFTLVVEIILYQHVTRRYLNNDCL